MRTVSLNLIPQLHVAMLAGSISLTLKQYTTFTDGSCVTEHNTISVAHQRAIHYNILQCSLTPDQTDLCT